jgi:hypothetical protein
MSAPGVEITGFGCTDVVAESHEAEVEAWSKCEDKTGPPSRGPTFPFATLASQSFLVSCRSLCALRYEQAAKMTQNQSNAIPIEDNFCSPTNRAFYSASPRPYKPLDNSRREIRLLVLKPAAAKNDRIECTLLDNMPLKSTEGQYHALSYAAGKHTDTEEILVDGRKFNAFRSLAVALRCFRNQVISEDLKGDVAIWADQITIDQSNPTERAYQVQQMREIYEYATSTIVYLGEDHSNGRAMAFMHRLFDDFISLKDMTAKKPGSRLLPLNW